MFRLARRWRQELATDAGAIRDWCRDHYEKILREPRYEDRQLALRTFLFLHGISRTPPVEAPAALAAALGREFARWEKMFPAGPET